MGFKNLDILLEKYLAGETTLEEERQLKAYFSKEDVPAEYESYKKIFAFTAKEIQLTPRETIKADIKEGITPSRFRRNSLRGIAAAISIFLVSMAVYFTIPQNSTKTYASVKEIDNPEEAYAIAKEALYLVSSKLNNGAAKAAESVERVKTINLYVKEK